MKSIATYGKLEENKPTARDTRIFCENHGKGGGAAMKKFNTTGGCNPADHYMVDISERLKAIKNMIDRGDYFCINRPRQYGKTTTMQALVDYLKEDYTVISLDFQDLDSSVFASVGAFTQGLSWLFLDAYEFAGASIPESTRRELDVITRKQVDTVRMSEIFRVFRRWCRESEKGIVLLIDEIDMVSDNQVFLDFLAQLRSGFLKRKTIPTWWSVILAGVTDVKHLKARIRPDEVRKENSPWNIAADFTMDMSLSETGIQGMLKEYEADHHTGMDLEAIARRIEEYTNGYPFLVSRICQLIDEVVSKEMSLPKAWSRRGVEEAVKRILAENNTLFQSLTKNLNAFPEMKMSLRSILMEGTKLSWNAQQDAIIQMQMVGLIRNDQNTVKVSNRIIETMLYNLFLSDEELKDNVFYRAGELGKNQFVKDGMLDMRLILERFSETYREVFGPLKDRFLEKDGREQFLLYLKPIINGTGNYYNEAQTRDQTRMDVIVDYLGQQYIIELKIWIGSRYNAAGERQIHEFLDYFGLSTGYC